MSYKRFFGALLITVFVVNSGRVAFSAIVDPLTQTFSVGYGAVGLAITLVWIGVTLPRIPVGILLTKYGRDTVIAGSGALLCLASLLTAVAPTIHVFAIGAFFVGAAAAAYFTAANPLISEMYPDKIGAMLGVHGMIMMIASVAAPVAIGLTIVYFHTWRTFFVILAIVAALLTVFVTLVARQTTFPDAGTDDRAFLEAVYNQWPLILTGIAIFGATSFVWNGVFNFYISYLSADKMIEEGTARTLLSVTFAAGVPAIWIAGRGADRLPKIPLILGILASFAVSLFAFTYVTSFFVVVFVSIVMSYALHSLIPVVDAFLLGSFPDHNRASAYAVYGAINGVIGASGSGVLGYSVEHVTTFDEAFRISSIVLLVFAILLAIAYRSGSLPSAGSPEPL